MGFPMFPAPSSVFMTTSVRWMPASSFSHSLRDTPGISPPSPGKLSLSSTARSVYMLFFHCSMTDLSFFRSSCGPVGNFSPQKPRSLLDHVPASEYHNLFLFFLEKYILCIDIPGIIR